VALARWAVPGSVVGGGRVTDDVDVAPPKAPGEAPELATISPVTSKTATAEAARPPSSHGLDR